MKKKSASRSSYVASWIDENAIFWSRQSLLLFNRSKGHGSGCKTALSGMHLYLSRVYFLTPPSSLCSDNTQNLDRSMVGWMPKQCPHQRPNLLLLWGTNSLLPLHCSTKSERLDHLCSVLQKWCG